VQAAEPEQTAITALIPAACDVKRRRRPLAPLALRWYQHFNPPECSTVPARALSTCWAPATVGLQPAESAVCKAYQPSKPCDPCALHLRAASFVRCGVSWLRLVAGATCLSLAWHHKCSASRVQHHTSGSSLRDPPLSALVSIVAQGHGSLDRHRPGVIGVSRTKQGRPLHCGPAEAAVCSRRWCRAHTGVATQQQVLTFKC
jgi:hypothetical protein